ncbi:MAG TPA: hypothetical protein VE309_01060 [Caulobacteraceae bacterium]|nr:hypothetical protein [Caulobacteraceae bacterium]
MKHLIAAACAAFSLGAAGAALADGQVTATLAHPTSSHLKLIAAHSVFRCADGACVAGYGPDAAGSLAGCKDLARQVGALTSYAQARPLSDKEMATCNAVAAAPKAATTASR